MAVLEIINDDMPFLLDSIVGEISERGLDIRLGRLHHLRGLVGTVLQEPFRKGFGRDDGNRQGQLGEERTDHQCGW